ncbi:neuraminidase-like domain-containing protein [Chitinophaga sp. Cy-1792]|uniref:Tc toxin subunit A-related protein n=1 Tax=Chitinophaga sp. Cy-1792 TaxID=2608339 RepID=UPI00141E5678|nr:neuraminidase-like domain-containing protein [Chitinophaga sp. Cy-1792]NIG55418.1 hypothetical protein [Chitinophaga sp. Cy-1792]
MSKAFNEEVSYMTLFPETTFNNITPAYSMYGPDAYLLYLIYTVVDPKKIAPLIDVLALLKRRPDIAQLQLNEDTTNSVKPYLQGVINSLLAHLVSPAALDNWQTIPQQHPSWQQAAAGKNSFVPYNRPVTGIRAGLNALGLSLHELAYHFAADGYNSPAAVYAELGLTATDIYILCNPDTGLDTWGPATITPDQLMMCTGLSSDQLLQLVYNGYLNTDTKSLEQLFINYNTAGSPPLQYQPQKQPGEQGTFLNISVERLLRIRMFLLLADKTGWDFKTLNEVLLQTGTKNFTTADIDKQLQPLFQYHFISKVLHKQFRYILPGNTALTSYPGLIAQLVHIAAGLDINVVQLKQYLDIQHIQQPDITVIYQLCLLQKQLTDAGSSLATYIPAFIDASNAEAKFDAFDKWFTVLQTSLQELTVTYNANTTDLPALMFKYWIHELSVYWGVNEDITYNLFAGYISKTGIPEYAAVNGIFSNSHLPADITKAKTFLEAWLPYVFMADRFKADTGVVYTFSGKLATEQPVQDTPPAYSVDHILPLLYLQEVYTQTIAEKRTALLALMQQTSLTAKEMLTSLPAITSWQEADIQSLFTAWNIADSTGGIACIHLLSRLATCFRISTTAALSAATINGYLHAVTSNDFTQLANIATAFESYLTGLAAKNTVLQNALRQQQGAWLEKDRNILVPIVLWSLHTAWPDIASWEHVSDYFLNDVSAGGALDIAPVREATDVAQSYLQRCRNGQEQVQAKALQTITAEEWAQLLDYRIWQAEQKLLHYPQQYFQIDNRTDATPVFNNFKNHLQQQDVDNTVAQEAIGFYIDEWLKLSDKTIVDAYYYLRERDQQFMITFLAKSNTAHQQYYYLEVVATNNELKNPTPWIAVDINIPASQASIIYIYNKYFIFWSVLSTKTDTDPGSKENKKYHLHTATINYITQDTRGNWQSPATWDSFPFDLDLEDAQSTSRVLLMNTNAGLTPLKSFLTPDQPYWQKPVPLCINNTLYVYLSPLIPLRTNLDTSMKVPATMISSAYYDFCKIVADAWPKQAAIVFPPRYMSAAGIISERVAPQILKTTDNIYLFPWEQNGILAGVASYPRFSLFDVLKSCTSTFYLADEFYKEGSDILNTLPQSGNGHGSNWVLYSVQAIRGMQAMLANTNLGSILISGTLGKEPMVFGVDQYNNAGVGNTFAVATFNMVTISNLFPQLYEQYFRVHGLKASLDTTLQAAPLATDAVYDYSNYRTGHNVILPAIKNATQLLFSGTDGFYATELFFYAPALIAQYLRNNLWNEAAMNWYRYIFNPLAGNANPQQAWQFYPFFSSTDNTFTHEKKWVVEQYIRNVLEWGDNEFRQETWESLSMATQLYFEATDLLGTAPAILDLLYGYRGGNRCANTIGPDKMQYFFSWQQDENLSGLWSLVDDRLHKLRNGLNIDGQQEHPSEYGTPLNPGRLKLAMQHGGINPYDDSNLKTNTGIYRFRELLPVTASVIEMAAGFGNQLLGILQQHDGEKLQLLQATHQLNMENFIVQNYQAQIDAAEAEILGLQASLDKAQYEQQHYRNLILKGLIPQEATALQEMQTAMQLQESAAALREGATIAHLIPTIFGFADGGSHPGSAIDSAAQILTETATVKDHLGGLTSTKAGYTRRTEEWTFNESDVAFTVAQLTADITAANKRLLTAQAGLQQQQLAVTQSREMLDYLHKKFTNGDLYGWMSGQLSSLYFKVYQLALAALHRLQAAYAYELNDQSNFIPANSWNSLRKGLLAADTLKLAVARLNAAYLNNNKRRQEAEIMISLKQRYAALFTQFQQTGKIDFKILKDNTWINNSGTLKIHAISVSIPAVISPYEVFNATFKNNGLNEQIIISRGIDDMGIFPDEFSDGRYLPFEGLTVPGADTDPNASWSLTIPDADLAKRISDVVITIKYKAF